MTCENCIHFCVCVFRDGTQINASCCAFYEQNDRPHGEWVPIKNRKGTAVAVRCSACGQSPKYAIESDFCPRCGADMRKQGEET